MYLFGRRDQLVGLTLRDAPAHMGLDEPGQQARDDQDERRSVVCRFMMGVPNVIGP